MAKVSRIGSRVTDERASHWATAPSSGNAVSEHFSSFKYDLLQLGALSDQYTQPNLHWNSNGLSENDVLRRHSS